MGKNANPADAFRKAQKAKELKKNKAERAKKREEQTVKRDTRDLEHEIASLKSLPTRKEHENERLKSLESELKHVQKLKEKYVAKHPEARERIMNPRRHEPREEQSDKPDPMAHLYNPDGTLRDPTRSVYYDATYNPYGVPPPGMPYAERPPSEVSSDESDEDESDDEIVMPEGPRPESEDDSDDSDDIPLPDGPPPPKPLAAQEVGWGHLMPSQPMPVRPVRPPPRRPPPNAGPSRPTLPPAPAHLPVRPGSAGTNGASASQPPPAPATATISAEPQLRDLRKEATAFVPRGVRKRGAGSAVNAAPGAGSVDAEGDTVIAKKPKQSSSLIDRLADVVGPTAQSADDEYQRFLDGLE